MSHATTLPDGSPVPPSTSPAPPKLPFSGVLELDNFRFDRKTEFKKIRAGIDQKREVRCGLRDCATPHGSFGKMDDIYFTLNGGDERSTVAMISLSHCCVSVPTKWRAGMSISVTWNTVVNGKKETITRTVLIPEYRANNATRLSVHFLASGGVRAFVTPYSLKHQNYPFKGKDAVMPPMKSL